MAAWHQKSVEDVVRETKTDLALGLTEAEAQQRLQAYGENSLQESGKMNPVLLFLNQFRDFMVWVLLAATLISGLLGEYTDAITIVAIVILNAILGFVQEYRAENSLQALKRLTAPETRVLREGKLRKIPAVQLVPGDVVVLESGDRIPADLRLVQTRDLEVEEAALTGESLPVSKFSHALQEEDLPLGDRQNMGFMGTSVTRGSGMGIVVGTGMETEMGKIAHLIQTEGEGQTPLQRRLDGLGRVLVYSCLLLTSLVVVLGLLQGNDAYQMFLAGVSLAVAAIPEGLPAIVTVALALGVQRMIKRKAIVRKLPAVETLGTATVICTDKTGTLTQNKMTVVRLWASGEEVQVEGTGYEPAGGFYQNGKYMAIDKRADVQRLLEIGLLCNNAVLRESGEPSSRSRGRERKEWEVLGDPTEGALLVAAAKAGLSGIDTSWHRVQEFPFDSERKMMSVVVRDAQNRHWVMVKGAPDVLLTHCTRVNWRGVEQPFTPERKKEVLRANEQLAQQALRNLAFAYRRLRPGESPSRAEEAERDLVFVGLAGMIDPPREEVRSAIALCRRAGIRTVMITGDHQLTAEAIARKIGLMPKRGKVLTGAQLSAMGEEELAREIDQVYVFARVSPEHKLRIVKALQAKGEVVAMTGDGVNDAPAIKAADIGVAMGIAGTDVTKEASSLVLSDDNFATIVAAVEEGRGIYDNIRKFIRYMLASNVGEILTMLFAMLMAMPLPLLPIQILWINLVTDGLPAMALGMDPAEGNNMQRPPRDAREGIFARGLGWKILSRGVLIGLVSVTAFVVTLWADPDNLVKAQTMAFATLAIAQLIHVFDCRCERSIFDRNPFENRILLFSVVVSLIMLIGVIQVPALQPIFHTTSLMWGDWMLVMVLAAIPTFVVGTPRLVKRSVALAGRAA